MVGIGEWDGGLYNSKGIDIAALWEYRQKEGTIHGFKGAERADTEELLITDCEILIPAATENVINSGNAAQGEGENPGRRRQRPHHGGRR